MEDNVVPKLFMFLLGCKPQGRHTEQHDIFFAIGNSISDLKPDILSFWPEANDKIHIDAWREVTAVGSYSLTVAPKGDVIETNINKLFFINLGGYKPGEFDELHYKMLLVADTMADASRLAKETTFYKHTGFEGAVSHIDDKYGVDVDDAFEIADVLPEHMKSRFHIQIEPTTLLFEDELHLGYLPLSKV
jgi:hypothetical protein